jgi:glycosyltransferase involved in cell wall biosynthesis
MKNLTLIIPAKNEKESLPIFLQEIEKYNCNKVVIIDSNDTETERSIKNFSNIKTIIQKKNGYGNAIIEGIRYTKTEYCCIINADGSMDPSYLVTKLEICKNSDFVFSSRYSKKGGSDDDDLVTFVGNKLFTIIGNIFFSLNISDILYTYIMAKTSSINKINLINQDFRICVELPIKAKRQGYQITCIPSFERARIGGLKKVKPFKDGFLILIELIRLFFNKK